MTLSTDFFTQELSEHILKAITQVSSEHGMNALEIYNSIEIPSDSSKGDFAFPCFKLSKALKKGPPQIANELAKHIKVENFDMQVVGGFLNFFINPSYLAKKLLPLIHTQDFFKLKNDNKKIKVMIEYSQPNTHKEFHVGHGRNVCLGDSIVRLHKYNNFNTMPVNYIGDEGAHIAKCLFAVRKSNQKIPSTKRAQWLGEKYVEAGRLIEAADENTKKQYEQEMSSILKAIESKEGDIYKLWQETRQYCLEDFNTIYQWLDVHFDHFFFESEVSEPSQKIVDEYLAKGVFKVDNGAVGIDMTDVKLGFMMVRKSDGNGLYITKDIALAKEKFEKYGIDQNIYVVANEQDFHFKQLFNFFKLAGFKQAEKCYHLSYGMVVRPDGKMSSRAGNSFTFFNLVDVIVDELKTYMEKYKGQWSDEQIEKTIHLLAVGAIKYGMLNTDPVKEIVFEPEKWAKFDGNSGPYLIYGYTRSRSILEKAQEQNLNANHSHLNLLTDAVEKELMMKLYQFNHAATGAMTNYRPSILCTYLFELCKVFNQFYVKVPVLKADNKELIEARLYLIDSFATTMKKGLHLIGITPPEKM